MKTHLKVDFNYQECHDHNHVKLLQVQKPTEVAQSSMIFVLLMALDIVASNYVNSVQECDTKLEHYKIAKQIGSFTKYLLLEGKYKRYDCEV